ncbi:MAG: S8 family serine peptidase [Bacteroidales bacterium]|nr:S8 family serine peptidase [Bacteroidales bacterium]
MKRHYITLTGLLMLACACSTESPTIDKTTEDSGPVMINVSPNAYKGEILIKVKDTTPVTKAAGGDIRELNDEIADALDEVQTVHFERLFTPDPRFEERTKAEGLDKWFCIEYEDDIAPDVMAELLSNCEGIAVIECSLEIEEDGCESVPGPVVNASGTASSSPFNDPYINQMRQWDFNNTGLVGNVTSVAGADANVYKAWELCTGSPDVIVGVFDQGVKYDHDDLAANMWVNEGEIPDNGIDDDGNGYIDDIYGWNFVDNDNNITSSSSKSHGTHVAGTISAVNNNGIGVCGIAGGSGNNDGVKIMSLQILSSSENGSSGSGTSGKIRAMKYAADNGAVISQNSWGYSTGSISLEAWKFGTYSSYTDAVKYFVKYAGVGADGSQTGPMKGGIVVCSAGNDATPDLLHYPSCDPNVIAVAATGMRGTPAKYTNYATWVSLSAPGGNSTDNSAYGQIYSCDINDDETNSSDYGYKQGTSMATPHVSGALALAISYYWGEEHKKGLTPEMLKAALLSSTKDVNQYCTEEYVGKMGLGALDTYKLLQTVKIADVVIPDVTLSTGGSTTITLSDYFISTNAYYSMVADKTIVKASISQGVLTLKGLKAGTTTVKVSDAKATERTINVTVR